MSFGSGGFHGEQDHLWSSYCHWLSTWPGIDNVFSLCCGVVFFSLTAKCYTSWQNALSFGDFCAHGFCLETFFSRLMTLCHLLRNSGCTHSSNLAIEGWSWHCCSAGTACLSWLDSIIIQYESKDVFCAAIYFGFSFVIFRCCASVRVWHLCVWWDSLWFSCCLIWKRWCQFCKELWWSWMIAVCRCLKVSSESFAFYLFISFFQITLMYFHISDGFVLGCCIFSCCIVVSTQTNDELHKTVLFFNFVRQGCDQYILNIYNAELLVLYVFISDN